MCFVEQGIDHLIFGYYPHDLAPDEEMALAATGGDSNVRLPSFAGPVHDASHDRDLDREFRCLESGRRIRSDLDDIDLGPATGRTGDQIEAGTFPQPEVFE